MRQHRARHSKRDPVTNLRAPGQGSIMRRVFDAQEAKRTKGQSRSARVEQARVAYEEATRGI